MKAFLTRETVWTLAGGTLFFAGAATAILAAPIVSTAVQNAVANTPRPYDTIANAVMNNVANNATANNATANNAIPARPLATSTPAGRNLVPSGTSARNVSWTTYKGNAQRTGASDVRLTLPLGLEWRYSSEADPGPIVGSPLILNTTKGGRLAIFNASRNIFALDSSSGELVWAADGSSTLRAPLTLLPSTSGGVVLMSASNGVVQAVRAQDGVKLWNFKADAPITVAPILVQTAKGARIVLAPNNGVLVALTTAGVLDPSWRVTLGSNSAPAASPSLSKDGKRLLVSARDGYLYSIDLRTARVAQTTNLGTVSPMSAIDTGGLIVTGTGSTAMAIRSDNNSISWRAVIEGEEILSVSQSGDMAYFATNRGTVLALRVRNGQQVWKINVGRTSLSGSPLVLPNVILVGGRDSILYGLDRSTGKVTWRYRVDTERSVVSPVRSLTTAAAGRTPNPSGGAFNPAMNQQSNQPTASGTSTGITVTAPSPTPLVNYELRTFGISSAPAIVDGQLFIVADNAALYSFATSFFDGAPPAVARTVLIVPTKEGGEYSTELTSNFPGIPLKGPVSMDVQFKDEGSGIDPARLSARFNGKPVNAADLKYNISSGVLRIAVQKSVRGEANELSDGEQTLVVEAVDYSGNTLRSSQTFNASAKFQSPSVPRLVSTVAPTPTPAPAPQSWRDRWDPRNGPPPWEGRGRRNRDNDNN